MNLKWVETGRNWSLKKKKTWFDPTPFNAVALIRKLKRFYQNSFIFCEKRRKLISFFHRPWPLTLHARKIDATLQFKIKMSQEFNLYFFIPQIPLVKLIKEMQRKKNAFFKSFDRWHCSKVIVVNILSHIVQPPFISILKQKHCVKYCIRNDLS